MLRGRLAGHPRNLIPARSRLQRTEQVELFAVQQCDLALEACADGAFILASPRNKPRCADLGGRLDYQSAQV